MKFHEVQMSAVKLHKVQSSYYSVRFSEFIYFIYLILFCKKYIYNQFCLLFYIFCLVKLVKSSLELNSS